MTTRGGNLNALAKSILTVVLGYLLLAQTSHAAPINGAGFVTIGGIDQWVTIHGADSANPVLLIIHGGPGDILSPYVAEFTPYEKYFTVVQWDQRGAGHTYGRYGEKTPDMSLSRVAADGVELAQYLRRHLDKKKILVLGHSWGTLIAIEMIKRKPDLFEAYIGTAQLSEWRRSNQAQYDYLKGQVKKSGNQALRANLEAIGQFDPENFSQVNAVNKLAREHLDKSDARWLGSLLTRAKHMFTPKEFEDVSNGMRFSGRAYRSIRVNLFVTAPRLDVPVFVIEAKDDLFTPARPVVAWFNRVQAPKKRLFLLDRGGHFALVTHQAEVLSALREARQEIEQTVK